MKKFLAMLMALAMVLSIVTIPVIAEKEDPEASIANPGSSKTVAPQDAATLNEALNVPGGTLEFVTEGYYPWFQEDHPWVIDGDAAKSNNVNIASSTSTVSTIVNTAAGDILQFDYMSFGEGWNHVVYDGLQLFIDDTKVIQWSRVEEWTTYTTVLTEGEHTIKWTYKKDVSNDNPGDYATVDNVYVGEPVHPSSVEVQDVTVPEGRGAAVQYTVLPAEAYDKSVTFEIADETIATVDENGRVRGVAEGTTTITVTAVDGGVTGTATVTVTEAVPTANFIGYITYAGPGVDKGYWSTFADYDPSVIENLGAAPDTFGAASAGHMIYGFNAVQDNGGNLADGRFYTIDTTVGMTPVFPGTSADRVVVGMAFDYTSNTLYAIAQGSGSGRSLFIVDRVLGTLTEVAAFDTAETIHTFAIDENGVGYGISYETSTFYRIDLDTAHCEAVGQTGVGMRYVQSMTYDMNNHQLFWAQYGSGPNDGEFCNGLYIVDPQTGNVTLAGSIGSGEAEVTGLLTLTDIEVPDPELPKFTVTFVDGLDNSTISSMTVEAGTVLDESDFPTPPTHEGYEFASWGYNGAPVYSNLTIKARYRDPNATMATIIFEADAIWADGSGYQMLIDADANAYGSVFPAEGPLTTSGSGAPAGLYDEFEYKLPENADGNLNTQNIIYGGSVTIEIPAGVYDWVITNPTPGDRIWIASDLGSIGGRADDFEFEAGLTYHFHTYLGSDSNYDHTDLTIGDDVPPVTDAPVTDAPVTDAPVTDAPVTDAPITNPPQPGVNGWHFESDAELADWTIIDQDGDGYNWERVTNSEDDFTPYDGDGVMMSLSYVNYVGPLTPDNWLITPEIVGGGSLTFWIAAQSSTFTAENMGVYVSTDGGATWSDELAYFTVTSEYQQKTVDLSDYAGMNIKVAFRHYDSTDMFAINLDAVEVQPGGATPGTPGDANGDGVVDVQDAVMVMRHALNLIALPDEAISICDMDGDGQITVQDAVLVMRAALGF